MIALGPALPISRRSRIGVPVGVRANLRLALEAGRYDVVHGFEPGLPSLSYLALAFSHSLSVATFLSVERLNYPHGQGRRDRLLARVDALLATSPEIAAAAGVRFPGDYQIVTPGIDPVLFKPSEKRNRIVLEWRHVERPLARSVMRALLELPGWELVLMRTKPLTARPTVPRALRGRVVVRTARTGAARATLLADAAIYVPAIDGMQRARLEAAAAGCAIAEPPGLRDQPELAGAAVARFADQLDVRERKADEAREWATPQSFEALGASLDEVYRELAARRRARAPRKAPLEDRDWIFTDLHLHTSWSHDCGVEVGDLLESAREAELGAIAVTDHNVFGGALEAVELARSSDLIVIPGEEVKTDNQGEVIGLFLSEEIPRGMSFAETIAAIREQNGIVYIPHPFDRLHAIPDPATLHRHLADIDVFEVYNARLLFESYNDEALRFARKYDLTMGAGSDAHVVQGVGTGVLRMRRFDGPEEFLVSLRTAQVHRRPKSLAYLQSLKWVAQVREKTRPSA